MKPFAYKMTPAYRHGTMTPWGGNALKTLYGKPIPDDRTGEALECSTLPGLESRAEDGRTLTEIAGGPLPLLLKLIDARECLSVQVHPDDAFALANEGKSGKEEAWLILHAAPGAKLVYGLAPDADLSRLSGRDIEKALRWVEVRPGDVLRIPAGMVHAIGAGIVLYEIQQASDVTYRFWDWQKPGPDGKLRELHWDKACAVSRPSLNLSPARGQNETVPGGTRARCLATRRFTLDLFAADGTRALLLPDAPGFRFVTMLSGAGALQRGTQTLPLTAGESCFVPKETDGVALVGTCEIAVAGEGQN